MSSMAETNSCSTLSLPNAPRSDTPQSETHSTTDISQSQVTSLKRK